MKNIDTEIEVTEKSSDSTYIIQHIVDSRWADLQNVTELSEESRLQKLESLRQYFTIFKPIRLVNRVDIVMKDYQ